MTLRMKSHDNTNRRTMHRTSATNRVMQIHIRVTLYPFSLAGMDARRWYCSQITRHADVGHGNERAVIAADDDIPDSMRLYPLNDTIRLGIHWFTMHIQQYVWIIRMISHEQRFIHSDFCLYIFNSLSCQMILQ